MSRAAVNKRRQAHHKAQRRKKQESELAKYPMPKMQS